MSGMPPMRSPLVGEHAAGLWLERGRDLLFMGDYFLGFFTLAGNFP